MLTRHSETAFTAYWSIWVVDADGSNGRRLNGSDPLETPDYEPEWSPDGSSILFTRGHDIYVMESDGSSVRLLTDGDPDTYDRSATWSPDGSQILFASDRRPGDQSRFYVMNADGTDVRPVGDLTGMSPDW
ncbi:MAG: TolB family protein [Actinomycetota bacterium]